MSVVSRPELGEAILRALPAIDVPALAAAVKAGEGDTRRILEALADEGMVTASGGMLALTPFGRRLVEEWPS